MRELVVARWNASLAPAKPFSSTFERPHANVPVAVNTEMTLLFGLPSVKKMEYRLDATFWHCSPMVRSLKLVIPNATALSEHALLLSGGV